MEKHPYSQLSKETLISKCIALEDILKTKINAESDYFDIQTKYQLLSQKYLKLENKIKEAHSKLEFLHSTLNSQDQNHHSKDSNQFSEKNDILSFHEFDNPKHSQIYDFQLNKLYNELSLKQSNFEQLQHRYNQLQVKNKELSELVKNNDQSYIDESEYIIVLQNEIARLNRIIVDLRLQISDSDTRRYINSPSHEKIRRTSDDCSFKVFNMLD